MATNEASRRAYDEASDQQDRSDADIAGGALTSQAGHGWEYLIVALPVFESAKDAPGHSASVSMLNREGRDGWEAIGMTSLADGTVAVLLKRPVS